MCTLSEMRKSPSFGSSPCDYRTVVDFKRVELRKVEYLVAENVEDLVRSWDEFFSD